LLVEHLEPGLEWSFVVEIFPFTIRNRIFRLFERVSFVVNGELFSREIFDWENLIECSVETILEKILITIKLNLDKTWKFEDGTIIVEEVSSLITINLPKIGYLRCERRNRSFFFLCHE
jgi:hypothetical protein